jgi:hypothetical protein
MSLVNVSQMDKLTVFALGVVAGIVLLILAFGFSRSPKASPATGAQPPKTSTSVTQLSASTEAYPSDDRPY